MRTDAPPAEAELLSEAIGVPADSVQQHSREPLGEGSITGLEVAAGGQRLLYYVDTSRLPVRVETGLASDDGADPAVRIWLHPADPHLPALAPVAFDHAAEALLSRLGMAAGGPPEMTAYRPGRRAVLRVPTANGAVWVKVVRPSRAQRLVDAHAAAETAGLPVPVLHGWSAEGLVVMAAAAGTPAADVAWEPEALLDEVDDLRRRVAEAPVRRRSRGVAHRIAWYEARSAPPLRTVLSRAGALIERAGPRSGVVVHGDLHFGQLFLGDDGGIRSVIDVDTLGVGDTAEDPAAFLAHAVASARLTSSTNAVRVWQLAEAALRRWGDDPVVRGLAAVHLVGHAVAASDRADRVGEDELAALAAAMLRAETTRGRTDEKPLMSVLDRPYSHS